MTKLQGCTGMLSHCSAEEAIVLGFAYLKQMSHTFHLLPSLPKINFRRCNNDILTITTQYQNMLVNAVMEEYATLTVPLRYSMSSLFLVGLFDGKSPYNNNILCAEVKEK